MGNLTIYDFEKEIREMAASCIGVNENTAKKKASKLFRKFRKLIVYSEETISFKDEEIDSLKDQLLALKTGKISYQRRGGETKGVLLIKDIEQVEVVKSTDTKEVLITTKSGRQITMCEDFEYLLYLFNNNW